MKFFMDCYLPNFLHMVYFTYENNIIIYFLITESASASFMPRGDFNDNM